jgi:hypothetical protein
VIRQGAFYFPLNQSRAVFDINEAAFKQQANVLRWLELILFDIT